MIKIIKWIIFTIIHCDIIKNLKRIVTITRNMLIDVCNSVSQFLYKNNELSSLTSTKNDKDSFLSFNMDSLMEKNQYIGWPKHCSYKKNEINSLTNTWN